MKKDGMRLRIIKNRPVFAPGGSVQDVTQQADTTSNPYIDMDMSNVPGMSEINSEIDMMEAGFDNIIGPDYSTIKMQEPSIPTMNISNNNIFDPKSMPKGTIVSADKEENQSNEKRSQDGNPLDPMTVPYYSPDLGGRAQMFGTSLGRIRAGNKVGANVAQAAFSGLSLGTGLARNIMGASSAAYAASRDEQAAREKLAKERRQQFIRWEREGGGVNLGNGQRIDSSDLTGEYIYPLPKSMEDNANVQIEKGEYVLTPDDVGPMEAKGNRHEDGGTPVDLPEAHIISDYRTIDDDFASYVRENYGIRATEKDTYATLLDRYKKKIGLSEKYDDQERVFKRLEKNKDVKDKNTSELNKSILSKYVNDNQKEIDELEAQFRSFADIVYNKQEESKRQEKIDAFFRDGGKVDLNAVRKQAKALNVSESDAKNWIYDEYVKRVRKMAEGGPTKEQIEWGKKVQQLLMKQFGRALNMSIVDVADREQILNPDSGVNSNQNLQHRSSAGYGRVNNKAISNLLDINRWANKYNTDGDFNTEGFQTGYNSQLNNLWALAESGAIANAEKAKKFRDEYGFWGEDAGKYDQGSKSAYNSFAVDDKFGQTTATRSFYGLDVVTPEQKRLLNEKGIKNYVDLFGDKSDAAKKILGADYNKFVALRDSGLMPEIDFVLESVKPEMKPIEAGPIAPGLTPPKIGSPGRIEVKPKASTPTTATDTDTEEVVEDNGPKGQGRPAAFGPIFPEMLRTLDTGLEIEGLERHQAPRIDPVLQSADQYINELNRATSAQLDAVGDVPDSQRSAILANMNAIAGSNIAKYINEVNFNNARQINEADRFNEMAYVQTDDKNIAERQRYESGLLKAMAIRDENLARYYDSINSEIQNKFNVRTSLNTIASIAPNMRMLPSGQIIYVQGNQDVMNMGDYSTPYLRSLNEEDDEIKRRRRTK
nr:MAG: hypothetical protein [Bacteriophage sp.]